MTQPFGPPFRADHVGSLLRPDRLKRAREEFLGAQTIDSNLGPHDNDELRAVEDDCVLEAIELQRKAGLRSVTDGEFRRRSWWLELIMTWGGVTATRQGANSPFSWRNAEGEQQKFSSLTLDGPIRWRPSAVARAFAFLAAHVGDGAVAKVTIPAPQMVHCVVGGDQAVRDGPYGDVDAFWDGVVAAYRQELAALTDVGARYIQFDDTSIAFLCDPSLRDVVRGWGREPEDQLAEYARRMNQVIEGLPDDVTTTLHQCRGNREGMWAAEGGYDFVAEVMFNAIDVDGYFLEYDSERTGGFEPLRFVPAGKVVALGLVSSKTAALEPADALTRRIEEASRFAPIERLALAPQCGFASSIGGNPLGEDDEAAKLARIVEVASEVWQDA
jgi:5-methyltetrahydropteroyltriglutamate--homocysteine methyltransferase